MTLKLSKKDIIKRFQDHRSRDRVDQVRNRKVDPAKFTVSLKDPPAILKGKPAALAIFDGDIVLYHTTMSCLSERIQHGEYYWHMNVQEARDSFMDRVSSLVRWMKAARTIIAFSGEQNFRKQLHREYKAHRAWTKPLGYFSLKQWVIDNGRSNRCEVLHIPKLEADDVMGIMATHPDNCKSYTPVIVTDDKDLNTIPGYHLKLKGSETGIKYIDPAQAEKNFWIQVLSGDKGDGYHGLRGVGPVRAEKIVGGLTGKKAWKAVVEAYKSAGLRKEDAVVQAQCAYILRAGNWDFKQGSVKLWQPPA